MKVTDNLHYTVKTLLLVLSGGKAKLSVLKESDVSSFLLRISASFPISTTPSGCVLESTACVATFCEYSTGLSSECTLLPTVISSVDLFWNVTEISSGSFISPEGFCLPVLSPQLPEMTDDETWHQRSHTENKSTHVTYRRAEIDDTTLKQQKLKQLEHFMAPIKYGTISFREMKTPHYLMSVSNNSSYAKEAK
uniref:Uncharacterized protein n=1 Tax=Glossina pallidipes TaxID=7398 RepID=A0A1A9ZBD5_GLOPL